MGRSRYLPGDIILTDSPALFSRLIRWVTSILPTWREKRTTFSHSAIVVDYAHCVEALEKVVITPLSVRFSQRDSSRYLVLRPKLPIARRRKAAAFALKQVGRPYSYWRLFLFLLDDAGKTRIFAEDYKDPHRLVCSALVALAYDGAIEFNGVPALACAPEDVYLQFKKHPDQFRVIDEA